ncbi:unnamed protein product [Didymodactylos carnosus]|uniref:BHLH domain-containing protein n=1 Tax=Didymodactylos carnosus TaxID=1234261 RepID=A0A8S2DYH4_9BILA|nr:unnamed protein product [Didymodactylos carnosus]CAF3801509.1 unnamed protein product [Didymodactylos carnosus]
MHSCDGKLNDIGQIVSEFSDNANISPLSIFTTVPNSSILSSRTNVSRLPSLTIPSQLTIDNNNNIHHQQQQYHHYNNNNHRTSKFALVPSVGTNGSKDVSSLSEQLTDNLFSTPQQQEEVQHVGQEKRRATHNEVERRRRDRINQYIQQLIKLIPDCSAYVKSQSNVLEKTIQYIHELCTANQTLAKQGLDADRSLQENDSLKERIRLLEDENDILKSLLTEQSHLCEHTESNMRL